MPLHGQIFFELTYRNGLQSMFFEEPKQSPHRTRHFLVACTGHCGTLDYGTPAQESRHATRFVIIVRDTHRDSTNYQAPFPRSLRLS